MVSRISASAGSGAPAPAPAGRCGDRPLHYPAHPHPGTGAEPCPCTLEVSKVTGWSGYGGVDVAVAGVRHGDDGRTVFPGRVAQPVFTL